MSTQTEYNPYDYFDVTKQDNLINIALNTNKSDVINQMYLHDCLLSKVSHVEPDYKIAVVPPQKMEEMNKNYNASVGAKEVIAPPEIKIPLDLIDMKRANAALRMRLTYEASNTSAIGAIAEQQLYERIIFSIQHAILYGWTNQDGLLKMLGESKWKPMSNTSDTLGGSGAWYSGDALQGLIRQYLDSGYRLEKACFLAGGDAFPGLLHFKTSRVGTAESLVEMGSKPGTYSIFGIPLIYCQAMKDRAVLFGDLSTIFLSIRDISVEAIPEDNGNTILGYNSAFDWGVNPTSGALYHFQGGVGNYNKP